MMTPAEKAAAHAADLLGRAVLPQLLSRLDGTTESFRSLTRRLSDDPSLALSDEVNLTRVEEAQGEAHRVGWFLGCLASAAGTNLLIARREENGLRLFGGLIFEAFQEEAKWSPGSDELPRVANGIGRGWELTFISGWLFFAAVRGERSSDELRWSLEERDDFTYLRVESALGTEDARLFEELTDLLPEARASASVERAELRVPRGWLHE